mmetsp:Transcript_53601/g.83471  ORF Transcript_53601/g.83471 Transcript_53601/m.83471 type:complete len:192 (-) Transcript_53601:28-603(-)
MADVMPIQDVLSRVLEDFRSPKFTDEKELFLNLHMTDFAKPLFASSSDGSYPHDWFLLHRKYKKLYEDQLANSLTLCNADFNEFMNYIAACNDAYGNDPCMEFMKDLTDSEDFYKFLEIMYGVVRDNWEPEPEAPLAESNVQIHPVDIQIPETSVPGDILPISYLGLIHQVPVPEGYAGGMIMKAYLQVPV